MHKVLLTDGLAADIQPLLPGAQLETISLGGCSPDPIGLISALLQQRRSQARPVKELHLMGHGEARGINLCGKLIDVAELLNKVNELANWQLQQLVLWSCELGCNTVFTDLLAEHTGAEVFSSKQRLNREHAWVSSNQGNGRHASEIINRDILNNWQGSLAIGSWSKVGDDIDGESGGDQSGNSISLSNDGSIVAIGANYNDGNGDYSGHVRIFQNINETWTQLGSDIDGEAASDYSGHSVSLSGDGTVVAIGAPSNRGTGIYKSGHVRLYKLISGSWWMQIGEDIDGEGSGDNSGSSISLSDDGSIVAIGAPSAGKATSRGDAETISQSGHVRIYQNINGTWTQIGSDIDGEAEGDKSGDSVSLSSDGSIVAIGAHYNDGNDSNSGHVRVYENINGTWTQVGSDIDGEAKDDYSGTSVSLSSDGRTLAIGANGNDGNDYASGHTRIYKNISGNWAQVGDDIDGEAEYDEAGTSVSLSGDGSVVAIGSTANDGEVRYSNNGHVRIFKNINNIWTQIGFDIDGEAEYDESGSSVSLSEDGSVLAIGAYKNDGNGSTSGHARIFATNPAFTATAPSAINISSLSFNENINPGYAVATLSSTDLDAGDSHSHSLVSGNGDDDNNSFTIDNDQLKINIRPDHEIKSSYTIRLESKDSYGLTFSEAVILTVNDLPENTAPTGLSLSATSFNENLDAGSAIGTLSSTDSGGVHITDGLTMHLDAGESDSYTGSGTTWKDLTTNGNNGTINGATYSKLHGGELNFDGTDDFVELAFPFTQSSEEDEYTVVIEAKKSSISSSREQLWSSDNGGFDWSFGSGDGSKFTIFSGYGLHKGRAQDTNWHVFTAQWSPSLGSRLYIDNSLDISTTDIYYDDGAAESTHIGNNPEYKAGGSEYWDGSVSTVLLYNRALDLTEILQNVNAIKGGGIGDSFTYSLVSGSGDSDNNDFTIDGDQLRIKGSPDFESKSNYTIRLQTTDSGGLSYSDSISLSVTDLEEDINNAEKNKAPTDLSLSKSSFDENIPAGTIIGSISSIDADLANTHTYALVNGSGDDDNSAFKINGDNLKINSSPDFENKPSYTIRLQTKDSGGLNFSKAINLSVTDLAENINDSDINKAPTDLSLSKSSFDENIPAGTIIGSISSIDADSTDTHTYSLVSGNGDGDGDGDEDNSAFKINGDKLVIKKSPDFETKPSYTLRLQTKDSGGLSLSKSVTLKVNDLAENSNPKPGMPFPDIASVSGDEITLQFPDELSDTTPNKLRFRVTVNGQKSNVLGTNVEPLLGMVFLTLDKPPAAGAKISLNYSDTNEDQALGVIELSDGTDVPSFSNFQVTNDIIESDPPELISAEISDNELTLDFNKAINQDESTLPSSESFKVKVNGRKVRILEISKGSTQGSVKLTLKDNIEFNDKVTLNYQDLKADQDTGVIQDLAGNDLLTFTDFDVINNSFDSSNLAFASAFVDGSRLEVNFDREIADTKPSAKVFRVEVDGKKNTIKSVDVLPDDRQVVLELQKPVTNQQAVAISYTDPKGNQKKNVVEDLQGNDLISFSQQAVGNDTEDTSLLSLDQGEVIDPGQILLNFSKQLKDTEPAASRFKVLVNNKRNKVDSIEMNADEGQVILNIKKDIAAGDSVTLNYKDLANDQKRKVIEDSNGNDLATIKNFPIENFVNDTERPIIDDAEFSNDQITLKFNEILAAGSIKTSRFKVTVNGKRNKVSSIDVPEEDTVVNMVLRKKIKADSDVLISYKDPKKDQKKGVLEDLAGNDVESFRDFLAVHIDDGDGPSLRTAAPDDQFSADHSQGLFGMTPVAEGIENLMSI